MNVASTDQLKRALDPSWLAGRQLMVNWRQRALASLPTSDRRWWCWWCWRCLLFRFFLLLSSWRGVEGCGGGGGGGKREAEGAAVSVGTAGIDWKSNESRIGRTGRKRGVKSLIWIRMLRFTALPSMISVGNGWKKIGRDDGIKFAYGNDWNFFSPLKLECCWSMRPELAPNWPNRTESDRIGSPVSPFGRCFDWIGSKFATFIEISSICRAEIGLIESSVSSFHLTWPKYRRFDCNMINFWIQNDQNRVKLDQIWSPVSSFHLIGPKYHRFNRNIVNLWIQNDQNRVQSGHQFWLLT